MIVFFPIYGVFVLLIFNYLTERLCLALEMEDMQRTGIFRAINMMIVILLLSSYLKIINSIV